VANGSFSRGKFLRMVDPRYNYSRRGAYSVTIPVIIAVFALLFMCVWLSSQAVKFNYEINELSKTRDKLKVLNRTLEIKLQGMMSSEGIAKAAKERYGFKDPDDKQVFVIKKEKNVFERLIEAFKNIGKSAGSI
jgi:cell division protein FtsL